MKTSVGPGTRTSSSNARNARSAPNRPGIHALDDPPSFQPSTPRDDLGYLSAGPMSFLDEWKISFPAVYVRQLYTTIQSLKNHQVRVQNASPPHSRIPIWMGPTTGMSVGKQVASVIFPANPSYLSRALLLCSRTFSRATPIASL
ncbi:hypothetical protein WG66_008052 [Moniliophthora roreri]|nr:hypothetical protein WG66_008052 [Moniliophthora roreri]